MLKADAALLEELREHVLHPDVVEGAVDDVLDFMQPTSEAAEAARQTLRSELREVEQVQAG
jgi:hypothetical protein